MIRNYIKIAVRTLTQHKLYTAINVAGLTFGITCFLLIGLFVFDELTFDLHHSKAERIYRVIEQKTEGGKTTNIAGASYNVAEQSKRTIPGIENTARLGRIGRANLVNQENPVNFQENISVANQGFLDIFDIRFISGDAGTALKEPNSIIVDEELARRLFGHTAVLGKALNFTYTESPFKITGVIKKLPANSSFTFNSLIAEPGESAAGYGNDWLSNNFAVFVLLSPGARPAGIPQKMKQLVLDNFKPAAGTSFSFNLQPLKDIHLRSDKIIDGARNSNVEAMPQGNPMYIKIFSVVAIFVLLIAGINYMNLTTARASSRLKEIGVRKTIGAVRRHLITQFLFETLLVTFMAFVLAIAVVNLLLPAFNSFTGKQLSLSVTTDYRIWISAFAFIMVIGLVSGSYPALLLSRFKPVLLLKGLKLPATNDFSIRKALVVFQFTISIIMIVATIVLYLQVRFMNNTNLGFDKELMVVIDMNTGKARTNFEYVKNEMAQVNGVKNVSVSSRVPGEWKSYRVIKVNSDKQRDESAVAYMFGADKDFLGTFDIDLIKGRNFDLPSDSQAVLLNETAAHELGITEAAGQTVEIPQFSRGDGNFFAINEQNVPFTPRVIGIVKDFHFQSLRDRIEPLVIAYHNNPIHDIDYYSVKISADQVEQTLAKLQAIMVANDKNDPFEFHFLDEQLARFYVEDQRRQTLLIWVALSTIFIACLGLFGLATYSAEQRVKEIGLRKVLGASVFNLTSLLSKDFLKLVVISNLIAIPISWWATNKWLQEYAYHIEVRWWIFGLAALIAVVIALFTVSFQAIKAAVANPIEALRTQ